MEGKSYFRLLKEALKLSRVNNLIIIFFTQYAATIFILNNDKPVSDVLLDPRLFALVLGTMIIAASGYYINDYYDIKIDLINKPDKVIVGRNIRRRPVMFAHVAMNLIGVLLGAWVSLYLGVINLICAVLLWWYSNQLKKLPFIGNLVVALMTSTTLLVLSLYFGSLNLLLFVYAFFAFGITLIREIIKDIEDMEGDASFGGVTLPIALGTRKTKWILYGLNLLFFISLGYFLFRLHHFEMNVYFGLMMIPYAHFIWKLIHADTKIAFTRLSNYSKWLIVAGIFSMVILEF
ncbi:geranylgeranylglycerol-phosphate geranylgeranyltransferase [Reichenbachiella ulvae]|uniref:Geranylgeranylglycerol-phosphate geranylgeranyltransferase n=1 Tax=Reichenbachiella ulvae TaxID=2980104 RepID=A0ABT3CYI1_9BACT|nr:geranylgeranylglycerol-phosphate geranylgeranyltransferase [Reichenbachiella ulvae]MCV9388614.1 geranylgeranylglycerol-phosphate geranylgeranyltransferase [Reichenbachiella ulvae]